MKYSAPGACPVCGGEFTVTALKCGECGAELRGEFTTCRFCNLSQEQMNFLSMFLRCKGSIKEMEKRLGISYPTIKNRLEALLTALDLQESPEKTRAEVLEALRKGEIEPQRALKLLERK